MVQNRLPLVSVIIPVYNHQSYLCECLNSVLYDKYPNKELVIIDDGSKDLSKEVVQNWLDKHEHEFDGRIFFLSRENKGLTKTLNELLAIAKGEFIALLASDDYLLQGGIKKRVQYLLDHPGKDAVFADCIVIDENSKLISKSGISGLHRGRKKRLKNDLLLPYELTFRWCVPGPVFMARRSLYDKIGYYDENVAIEDWDFYLRIAAVNLLGFLDEKVAAYRVDQKRVITNAAQKKYDESMLAIIEKHEPQMSGCRKYRLLGYKRLLQYKLQDENKLCNYILGKVYKSYSKILYESLVRWKLGL